MSSTEPPSRIPPRQGAHETKAARDELSSKGKVEKVREVDPDEEARKKKFMQYYKGVEEEGPQEERPSPFDIYSGKAKTAEEALPSPFGAKPAPSFGDVEDAAIPGPSSTPPPTIAPRENAEDEDEVTSGVLPQSEDFWEDFDLPDQPIAQAQYQEITERFEGTVPGKEKEEKKHVGPPVSEHKKRVQEIKKKEEEVLLTQRKVEKKEEMHEKLEKRKKEEEPPPFLGPPGKAAPKEKMREAKPRPGAAPFFEEKKPETLKKAIPKEPESEKKKKLPSPYEKAPTAAPIRPRKETELRQAPSIPYKQKEQQMEKEEGPVLTPQEIAAAPLKSEERELGGGGKRGKEEQILEIEAPSLPELPKNIQPMAMTATTQASSFLTPATVSLFYQMVGTFYVMAGQQGINRTEVVLNNPAYANSKFYGATITIEKYATAPDSFNIRLTGSHEAVTLFKDNIPSLLTAFQNGNFSFRIGRIDAEYTIERPIFRRKEKGGEKGEAGSGDLRERKNR